MIRNEVYGDGGLERVVEVTRSDGSVLYRELDASGEIVVEREATPEEVRSLEAHERSEKRHKARRGRATALERLAGRGGLGEDVLTVLVSAGIVTVEDAEAAGWTPPE